MSPFQRFLYLQSDSFILILSLFFCFVSIFLSVIEARTAYEVDLFGTYEVVIDIYTDSIGKAILPVFHYSVVLFHHSFLVWMQRKDLSTFFLSFFCSTSVFLALLFLEMYLRSSSIELFFSYRY
jgi:hypothetical protein